MMPAAISGLRSGNQDVRVMLKGLYRYSSNNVWMSLPVGALVQWCVRIISDIGVVVCANYT